MSKCTIRFIRDTENTQGDDVITIYEDEEFGEMYRIVFRPTDFKKTANEFYLEQGRVIEYISSILKTLPYDADPFRYVQVDSCIYPSVLYNVSDLTWRNVRYTIEDTVEAALRRPVGKIRMKA